MPNAARRKIIYLDQKGWIELAKSRQAGNEIADVIIGASEARSAIFPLSITHIEETNRIQNLGRKRILADLMVRVSRGYSFSPYVDTIIGLEVQQAVSKKLGYTTTDLKNHVIGRGFSHIIGTKPKIVRRNGRQGSPPYETRKKMFDILDSPDALFLALTSSSPSSIRQKYIETANEMEGLRQELVKIKDNNLRQRFAKVRFLIDIVLPKLEKVQSELHIPANIMIDKEFMEWTRNDFETFLDSLPTALCLFTLTFEGDQHLQRPIDPNDINDVWALTLAIPYSDIVVTEKMWTSISTRKKLDRKCNTIILSTVDDLNRYL